MDASQPFVPKSLPSLAVSGKLGGTTGATNVCLSICKSEQRGECMSERRTQKSKCRGDYTGVITEVNAGGGK